MQTPSNYSRLNSLWFRLKNGRRLSGKNVQTCSAVSWKNFQMDGKPLNTLRNTRFYCSSPRCKKLSRNRKVKTSLFIFAVLIWGCTLMKSQNSKLLPLSNQHPMNSTSVIHICVTVVNSSTVSRAITMLRSMLYFYGRIGENGVDDCGPQASKPPCYRPARGLKTPLQVHILTDQPTRRTLLEKLYNSRLRHVSISFYEIESYEKMLGNVPNRHPSGIATLIKLFLPEILPAALDKVIVLDTDVLFNEDIRSLWAHFHKFDGNQIIGAVLEQTWYNYVDPFSCVGPIGEREWFVYKNLSRCRFKKESNLPRAGINGGLLLLRLDRMRKVNWNSLWKKEYDEQLQRYQKLLIGEQGVIDGVLWSEKGFYYKLPCNWNVQTYEKTADRFCPVSWLDRVSEVKSCRKREQERMSWRYPALIHYNSENKRLEENISGQNGIATDVYWLKNEKMQLRFIEIYQWFQKLPPNCFD